MKTIFHWSQFNVDNTPALIKKIGNYCMLIGSMGAIVATLPFPKLVVTLSAIVAAIGTVGKIISKFFGQVNDEGNPVVTVPTNATIVNPKSDEKETV